MNVVTFTVYGNPKGKGSFTRMPNGAMLPAGSTASRLATSHWRDDVKHAALMAMGERPPVDGAIRLMCEFRLPVPKSSIRKYQYGWLPHVKQPDVDKLFRMLGDALTGIVWRDDSQVCFSAINKVYAWDGKPGALVEVDAITDESAKQFATHAGVIRDTLNRLADYE